MSMPEKMPLARVAWVDSNHTDGWRSVAKMRVDVLEGGMLCESVGYLFVDAEDRVVLVQSVSDTGMVDSAMTIPRVAVVSIAALVDSKAEEPAP